MKAGSSREFSIDSVDPKVRGFLHESPVAATAGLVLTHGAGGNAQGALLTALAEEFSAKGIAMLRCNLPFRLSRPFGPPRRGDAASDRAGLKNAALGMKEIAGGTVFLGGQSYGGRQASMLCAEELDVAAGLLLLSYPLHPPGKADQLRTQHFPKLRVPCLFVHGTHDPFGTIEEIEKARRVIPAKTELLAVEGAGHDLGFKGKASRDELPENIFAQFRTLFGVPAS